MYKMTLETLVIRGNEGAIRDFLGSHQKELGINLKSFPLAKYWTIWASISIRNTYIETHTICLVHGLMVI